MDLTPEDDDLLSYFLSADVGADELAPPSQPPKPDALNASGTAPLYPSLGGGVTPQQSATGASDQFAYDRSFGSSGQQAGSSSASAAVAAGGMATLGPLSSLSQMQHAYQAAENAMIRSSSADEEAMSGAGLDSDEKRQRRCVHASSMC